MNTKVWAHRGASAYAPENTLSAFELAVKQKADGIELDIHFTKDREIVVTHDDNVLRVTGYDGLIAALTLKELKKLDFSNKMAKYIGEKIPTLSEVLDLIKPSDLVINIELKTNDEEPNGLEEACQTLVESAGMADRVLYSSFNHHSLIRLHEIAPEMPLGILYGHKLYKPWDYAKLCYCQAIHPHYNSINSPGYMDACHAAGIRCHAWTVDDKSAMQSLIDMGVDAIITNRPDLARALLPK